MTGPAGPARPALEHLEDDLRRDVWRQRYADLLGLEERDAGYRLVLANGILGGSAGKETS